MGDTMRTFVVWGVSLALGWEFLSWVQLIGFLFVTFGICLYNEIVTLKCFFTYPVADGASKSFVGDADHGSFLGKLEDEQARTLPLSGQCARLTCSVFSLCCWSCGHLG